MLLLFDIETHSKLLAEANFSFEVDDTPIFKPDAEPDDPFLQQFLFQIKKNPMALLHGLISLLVALVSYS